MGTNVVAEKSYDFALLTIRLYKHLIEEKREFVLSKQMLRSGTAIGALIREAEHAQSKSDFLSKMNIALKEANETVYWLDLLKDSEYINQKQYDFIYPLSRELVGLLVSIVKTTKNSLKK